MGVTDHSRSMFLSRLSLAIPALLFVCATPGVCGAGGEALDEEQALYIKAQIEELSKMTKGDQLPDGEDAHQLLRKFRLNVEMPDDAGRDGFVEFLGSPTIVVQANGEVQIKGEDGILLTADGKFDEALFDRVFGKYNKMFRELQVKQDGLMHQIKMLQKQVVNEQKGDVTRNIAGGKFTFFQNGTVFVSREFCEPSCITERGFFHEEIDDDIFNMIFPQDILANITLAEASGLDTKGDDISSDPEPENEPENEPAKEREPAVGAVHSAASFKNFASPAIVVFLLSYVNFVI